MTIEATGAQIVEQNGNRLIFTSPDQNFVVKVTGFDEHRDVEIRINHEEVEQ